jgi:hypothetical protein
MKLRNLNLIASLILLATLPVSCSNSVPTVENILSQTENPIKVDPKDSKNFVQINASLQKAEVAAAGGGTYKATLRVSQAVGQIHATSTDGHYVLKGSVTLQK